MPLHSPTLKPIGYNAGGSNHTVSQGQTIYIYSYSLHIASSSFHHQHRYLEV
jgi:hypothetical protein